VTSLSVIIPVKDAAPTLERCLASIFASSAPPLEVIVVDDGSTDGSPAIARRFPVTLLDAGSPGGVANARNVGAARGDVLFFTDGDVVLFPETLAAVARRLADPTLDGVVGVQSEAPAFANFASDYKNLWLRYTYLRQESDLAVLYSSVLAVRAAAFRRVDGFDPRYRRPNIEDSDLGKRLAERGARLRVAPEVEILHIKRYTLRSLLVTDFARSSGLLKVQLRDGFRRLRRGNYTSIPSAFVAALLLSWLVPLALVAPGGGPRAAAAAVAALAVATPLLLADLLGFFLRLRGPLFVARVLLLLPIDFAAITLGLANGLVGFALGLRW
jgi:glycosyltransferase involved in cell wall biosynthesis